MDNAELFLDRYKTLEQLVKSKFNLTDFDSAIYELSRMNQFKRVKDDLNYIREVRNLLQHRPLINGEYPIEPSKHLISRINQVINYLNNPPTAYDICKKISQVSYAKENDLVYKSLKNMVENGFSHIPLLSNNKVVGVFSDLSISALTLDGLCIDNNIRFTKEFIYKYCSLNLFGVERYKFIAKKVFIEDIQDIFNGYYEKNKRIAMLFVTETGNSKESVLGIITTWDAMDKD